MEFHNMVMLSHMASPSGYYGRGRGEAHHGKAVFSAFSMETLSYKFHNPRLLYKTRWREVTVRLSWLQHFCSLETCQI